VPALKSLSGLAGKPPAIKGNADNSNLSEMMVKLCDRGMTPSKMQTSQGKLHFNPTGGRASDEPAGSDGYCNFTITIMHIAARGPVRF
jgi:hypothetical protein